MGKACCSRTSCGETTPAQDVAGHGENTWLGSAVGDAVGDIDVAVSNVSCYTYRSRQTRDGERYARCGSASNWKLRPINSKRRSLAAIWQTAIARYISNQYAGDTVM